ncbi:phospholipase A and acyltransferase 2-like [Genypterus blacodes]|uniref:phospholipase A and acyltransferase 2-like n=1 Tax=Genypterus blacodes TaxID=154954 RepID=UPI003F764649
MDYQEQIDEIVSTAKLGDLIEFSYPVGYSHWAVYDEDGFVLHFAVADEGHLMNTFRMHLQSVLPVCGDMLLGETKIRRVPLGEVNVPKGAHISISNNRHAYKPSDPDRMRQRRDALLDEKFSYHLLSLNCEHFATFVRFGKAVCNQIPGRDKNKECEYATGVFQDIVSSKSTEGDLFKGAHCSGEH